MPKFTVIADAYLCFEVDADTEENARWKWNEARGDLNEWKIEGVGWVRVLMPDRTLVLDEAGLPTGMKQRTL